MKRLDVLARAVDNPPVPRRLAPALVAALLGATSLLLLSGCGANPCQEMAERTTECLGGDEYKGDEITDEECTGDIEAENECLLDQSCDDVVSGLAYSTCAGGG